MIVINDYEVNYFHLVKMRVSFHPFLPFIGVESNLRQPGKTVDVFIFPEHNQRV